jgi:hypothetical protein
MRLALRSLRANWLSGGAHAVIVVVAAQADSAEVWPYALALMAVVSFFAWMANYRRFRLVHDVPTSKVASAAQGYIELLGKSAQIANQPLVSPLKSVPCCWYRYCVARRTSDNKWQTEDEGESAAHFLLVDETGECVIAPDGAEILYPRSETWTVGNRRYTEELLLPGGILYALGEFSTHATAALDLDSRKAVSGLLSEWKKDVKSLVLRFDANRDGKVDLREWEAARLEAHREVAKRNADALGGAGLHRLSNPHDGRCFIIAAALPAMIGRRYAMWSWAHLAFFFAAGAASYLLFVGGQPS